MDTFIAVVFDNEEAAFKGAEALRDLHQKGDIVVYSSAVIAKEEDGSVAIRKATESGPIGTAFGALIGALVGVLAAPIAAAGGVIATGAAASGVALGGMAVGGFTGGMFGMFRDLYQSGIDADTLEKVSIELGLGKSAVVAAVDEAWMTPLDVTMKEAGGTIFRKRRIDVIDEQIERDMAASEAELQALQEEWNEADEALRDAISSNIDSVRKRLSDTSQRAQDRLEQLQAELDARLSALDEQIENAVGQAKTKFEKRRDEVREEYAQRSEKLKQAAGLAKQALS